MRARISGRSRACGCGGIALFSFMTVNVFESVGANKNCFVFRFDRRERVWVGCEKGEDRVRARSFMKRKYWYKIGGVSGVV